jgi:uncharacterized protein YcaQ
MRTLTPELARRFAIVRQRLSGAPPPATPDGIYEIVQDIGCLQLDPISAVARSHLLVLRSRLGVYDPAHLDTLLWKDRRLFEYWAHAASIVLTEDYPIHHLAMRNFHSGTSPWSQRSRAWMEENKALRDDILAQIRAKGPLPSKYFEDKSQAGWTSTGWTGGRNVSRMLDFLWINGTIMVAGRQGGQKLWDLAERCLPEWTPRDPLDEPEIVRRSAQKAVRALGVARLAEIKQHYTRGRYNGLPGILSALEKAGTIEQVQIVEDGKKWPGPWYVHVDDMLLLDRLEAGDWSPRTTLLSPFDNLICDRARTERLFNFNFRIEIYVPKAKRQYGYYVLPILHGDRLIGRIDPTMDRKKKRLMVNAVYAEPDAPMNRETAKAVSGAIDDLAKFLGAKEITFTERVPDGWRKVLK